MVKKKRIVTTARGVNEEKKGNSAIVMPSNAIRMLFVKTGGDKKERKKSASKYFEQTIAFPGKKLLMK